MLKRLEIAGFKSFARKTVLDFSSATTAIVGPNGSGKSNVAEAFRFALGEQSMKSMRGKKSEDLIWAGSHATARQNRAAVSIVFDNTPKKGVRIFPKLEFDEVAIERAVFRDGASEYAINGSKARLRDIQELLASANIGETGHHIISQGEADRILSAHPRERRAMLEDALGLKVFEFKKQEAERKLEKTEENMREVEAIRRELAPHIRFLQKQVEKLERAEELARELGELCRIYFAIEDAYLAAEKERLTNEKAEIEARLEKAAAALAELDTRSEAGTEAIRKAQDVRDAEAALDAALAEASELSRVIGRLEGALESARQRSAQATDTPYVKVARDDFSVLLREAEGADEHAAPEALRAQLVSLKAAIRAFYDKFGRADENILAEEERNAFKLESEHTALLERDAALRERVEKARTALQKAREAKVAFEETGREERHRLLEAAQQRAHEEAALERVKGRLASLVLLAEELTREKAEVVPLAGRSALSYSPLATLPEEERRVQEDRKRQLERLKIRVEEAGGSGEDVRSEYEETKKRDEFLEKEVADLLHSAQGLRSLIDELDAELQKTFSEGLAKVNASFGEFFSLMFGGGSAKLVLEERDVQEDDDEEPLPRNERMGIDISVSLPKKRVQSLMQLSGGERALTSIALIFAMSQVNPPPFLILDETDAALDEANSRRYGDMIENLAKRSQLIVITHNRETMSRAGILYGVTMGSDGVSKLLSVKFEEAAAVAK